MRRGWRQRFLRHSAIILVLAAFGVYVMHDAVYGVHGLLAREQLTIKISVLNQELQSLRAQRKRLEEDEKLLTTKAATEPQLVDEEARSLLDLARPSEIVIINDKDAQK
jgi:cell division protein FtsB